MGGLVKGIRLMEAFDGTHSRMTLTEAARKAEVTPASARRCLLTLCQLGYLGSDGKHFWVSHGTLRFAHAYAASTRLPGLIQPILDAMCERTKESATLAVLDVDAAVVAARSSSKKTMRVGLCVGSRMPLYCSATGRSLLVAMPDAAWREVVQRRPMVALTSRTETSLRGLAESLKLAVQNDYTICDQEVEIGVRAIAVPLRDRLGNTIAAVSVATRAERLTVSDLISQCLRTLRGAQEWSRTTF